LSGSSPDAGEQVEVGRGGLRKLQLLIPGLRGYKSKEDARFSDDLLRNKVAERLNRVRGNLEEFRQQVASSGDLANLTNLSSLISEILSMSREVSRGARGYAGWVPPVSINEQRLNRLYDYDYSFVNSVLQLDQSTAPENLNYDSSALESVQASLDQLSKRVQDIRRKWALRIETIEGIALT